MFNVSKDYVRNVQNDIEKLANSTDFWKKLGNLGTHEHSVESDLP